MRMPMVNRVRHWLLLCCLPGLCVACSQPAVLAGPGATPSPAAALSDASPGGEVGASPQAENAPDSVKILTPLAAGAPPTIFPSETVEPGEVPGPAIVQPLPALFKPSRYDLLYLSEGAIRRFRLDSYSDEQFSLTLPSGPLCPGNGGILKLLYDRLHKRLIVVRSQEIAANGISLYCLEQVDYPEGTQHVLATDTPMPLQVAYSPDGRWLAYQTHRPDGGLYLLKLEGGATPHKVAESAASGDHVDVPIAWSADSQAIAWLDSGKVWRIDLDTMLPRLVLSDSIIVQGLNGEAAVTTIRVEQAAWSPAGRYLLVSAVYPAAGARWQGIVDTRARQVVELPGTYAPQAITARAAWLDDGRLVMLHLADSPGGSRLTLEIGRILPANPELFSIDETRQVDLPTQIRGASALQLVVFERVNSLVYSLVIASSEPPGLPAVYLYNFDYNVLTYVTAVPARTLSVSWAPDASEALVTTGKSEAFYTRPAGLSLVDMAALLGTQSRDWIWAP